MRRVVLCFLVGACASPAPRPTTTTPLDVWEPFGQPGMRYGALAMDGDGVWFIADQYPAPSQGTLFLTKTTTSGDTLIPATNVDGPGPLYYGRSAVTVTDTGVVVSFMREDAGDHPYIRAYDHDGVARAAAQRVPVVVGGVEVPTMDFTALTRAADGHARLMTSLSSSASEVALVDVDATGTPTGTSVAAGTPDGGQVGGISAATLGDDSTLIAWDHAYDACSGDTRPPYGLTAVVDPGWHMTVPAPLSNQPGYQDIGPVVVSRGGAAYMVWTTLTPDAQTVWLAPYAGLDAAVEIAGGTPVLADAAHGVLVGFSADSMLQVQPFENTGSGITLGDARVYPPVDSDPETYKSLAGAVSLGGTRYLLAWEEQPQDWSATRLYAAIVDLADPAAAMAPRATPRLLQRPCI